MSRPTTAAAKGEREAVMKTKSIFLAGLLCCMLGSAAIWLADHRPGAGSVVLGSIGLAMVIGGIAAHRYLLFSALRKRKAA
jgi:hypothetical protein